MKSTVKRPGTTARPKTSKEVRRDVQKGMAARTKARAKPKKR